MRIQVVSENALITRMQTACVTSMVSACVVTSMEIYHKDGEFGKDPAQDSGRVSQPNQPSGFEF